MPLRLVSLMSGSALRIVTLLVNVLLTISYSPTCPAVRCCTPMMVATASGRVIELCANQNLVLDVPPTGFESQTLPINRREL